MKLGTALLILAALGGLGAGAAYYFGNKDCGGGPTPAPGPGGLAATPPAPTASADLTALANLPFQAPKFGGAQGTSAGNTGVAGALSKAADTAAKVQQLQSVLSSAFSNF